MSQTIKKKSKRKTVSYYYKNEKRTQVEPPKVYICGPYYFIPSRICLRPLISENSRSIAAAAAKSLQFCPILCDPIDSSPPGSPIPGIL